MKNQGSFFFNFFILQFHSFDVYPFDFLRFDPFYDHFDNFWVIGLILRGGAGHCGKTPRAAGSVMADHRQAPAFNSRSVVTGSSRHGKVPKLCKVMMIITKVRGFGTVLELLAAFHGSLGKTVSLGDPGVCFILFRFPGPAQHVFPCSRKGSPGRCMTNRTVLRVRIFSYSRLGFC